MSELPAVERALLEAARRRYPRRRRARIVWLAPAVAALALAWVVARPVARDAERPAVSPTATATATAQPVDLSGVRVDVSNAAGATGVTSTATLVLEQRGARTHASGWRGRAIQHSIVVADAAHRQQAQQIAALLAITDLQPARAFKGALAHADVAVVLAKDFAEPSPSLLAAFAVLRGGADPGGRVRVTANRTGACLHQRDPGGGGAGACTVTSRVLAGELAIPQQGSGALGLVPDGVDAVTLRDADGTRRTLRVHENLWTTDDPAARAITLRLPGGRSKTVDIR